MVRSNSFKKILELKKKKTIETTLRICHKRNFPIPAINFKGCNDESSDELAHYHPETNTICISERQLIMLDFDNIAEVIAHEVAHILIQNHSPEFRQQEELNNISNWEPPAGVIWITGKKRNPCFKKKKQYQSDKIGCDYHSCREERGLSQCEYCKKYYCWEHKNPFSPWGKNENGHPCPIYFDYQEQKAKESAQKYNQALGRLLRTRSPVKKTKNYDDKYNSDYPDPDYDGPNSTSKKSLIYAFLVLFLILGGFFFLIYLINNVPSSFTFLDDMKEKFTLSSLKETFKDFNQKIWPAEIKDESQKAFDYVNQLRKEKGRKIMRWDENLYNLAVARSKDMYERKYFDHTTPEGKCVKDFKYAYGLGKYNIAENIGGQYNGYGFNSPASSIDVIEQVNGWMESRGHRYNLLYITHEKGAIGCYYGICVFLGANTDPYGFGYGPCTTGEAGLDFWENAPRQPFEK